MPGFQAEFIPSNKLVVKPILIWEKDWDMIDFSPLTLIDPMFSLIMNKSELFLDMQFYQLVLSVESICGGDRDMLSWFTHNEGMKRTFNLIAELLDICQEFAQEQRHGRDNDWY